jgi:hypothetical protein
VGTPNDWAHSLNFAIWVTGHMDNWREEIKLGFNAEQRESSSWLLYFFLSFLHIGRIKF